MNKRRWLLYLAALTLVATLVNVATATEIQTGCWVIGSCVSYYCQGGVIWKFTETKWECREGGFWYTYCGVPDWLEAVGWC